MRSAVPTTRSLLLALTAAFACGGRSSLDVAVPSAAVDAAAGTSSRPMPEAAAPPTDSGTDAPSPACRGEPWVIFSLSTSGPDQGPLSHRLYARHPSGAGGHVLHFPHEYVVYPSVSHDGSSIVYADASLDALYLYRFGAASDVTLATTGTTGFGALSPDGTTVAYGDGNNIWRVPADGGGTRTLLVDASTLPEGAAGYPVFAQDSETVIFGSVGAVSAIAVGGGATRTLVASASGFGFGNPALSPDYASLAAIVSCDGTDFALRTYPYASLPAVCESGAFIVDVTPEAAQNDPAWGPTGIIAYADVQNVILVTLAGTTTNLTADLTGMTDLATEPTWAPACMDL